MANELYTRVASLTGPAASGPVLFKVAVDQVMFMNANMICNLSNQHGMLKLKDMEGENIVELGKRVTELAREIEGSGKPPYDLSPTQQGQ